MDIETADDVVQDQLDDAQAQADEQQASGETLDGAQSAADGDDVQASADDGADEDGEVVITIGDEMPPADDQEEEIPPAQRAAWARMRKTERELKQKVREYEQAEAARKAASEPKPEDAGPEPQLEEFDFDGIKYRDALLAWNERKRKADEMAAKQREEQEAAATAWQKKLDAYKAAGAALKVEDFDGAEHIIRETMSPTQQAVIVSGADKPELVVYALGRNPALAKELAAIKDPVKFAFRIAKLETQLKVTPRNTPPAPEKQVRGTAGGATAVDNTLARLEAEADRTGDRSKVLAYKREQRNKAAA